MVRLNVCFGHYRSKKCGYFMNSETCPFITECRRVTISRRPIPNKNLPYQELYKMEHINYASQ